VQVLATLWLFLFYWQENPMFWVARSPFFEFPFLTVSSPVEVSVKFWFLFLAALIQGRLPTPLFFFLIFQRFS